MVRQLDPLSQGSPAEALGVQAFELGSPHFAVGVRVVRALVQEGVVALGCKLGGDLPYQKASSRYTYLDSPMYLHFGPYGLHVYGIWGVAKDSLGGAGRLQVDTSRPSFLC